MLVRNFKALQHFVAELFYKKALFIMLIMIKLYYTYRKEFDAYE